MEKYRERGDTMKGTKKIIFVLAVALIIVAAYTNSGTRASQENPFASLACNTSQGAQTAFIVEASSKENSRWTSLFVSSAAGEEPIVDIKTGVCKAGNSCRVTHYAPFPGLGRTWTNHFILTQSRSYSRTSIGCIPS